MPVKSGNKVKVHYVGTFDDGTTFDSSDGKEPLEFEVGAGMVIKGFDDAVIGMENGQKKSFHVTAQEGYGEYQPELVHKVPLDKLPPGEKPQVGMMLGLSTPDGMQFTATIKEVHADHIMLDINHPLAGKALNFAITVVSYN